MKKNLMNINELNAIASMIEIIDDTLWCNFQKTSDYYNPNEFPEHLQELGQAILAVCQDTKEFYAFSKHLSDGDLEHELPSRQNYLAGNLKALHSHLRHLTWQAQQIAKGDYSQKVDFMGAFSSAFNSMSERLAQRESQLLKEIQDRRKVEAALQEQREMMLLVFNNSTEEIFVTDGFNHEVLFANRSALEYADLDNIESFEFNENVNPLVKAILEINLENSDSSLEWEFFDNEANVWHGISTNKIPWTDGSPVYLSVCHNISRIKLEEEKLHTYAYTDPLTGLYNRRTGLKRLEEYLIQLKDESDINNLCIGFTDLDNLKDINDNYGHKEGDFAINYFGQSLKNFMRKDDMVCRMGGDEFLIIMPNCGNEEAKASAKIIKRIEKHLHEYNDSDEKPYNIEFSYGLVTANKDTNSTAKELIDEADKIMYYNKQEKKRKSK